MMKLRKINCKIHFERVMLVVARTLPYFVCLDVICGDYLAIKTAFISFYLFLKISE